MNAAGYVWGASGLIAVTQLFSGNEVLAWLFAAIAFIALIVSLEKGE